jgi:hypothetical protein
METLTGTPLDIGVSRWALTNAQDCGDAHLVSVGAKSVLVAVVDGLGHGPDAATATRSALRVLERHPDDELVALLTRCHVAASGTRGIVMSMARFDWGRRSLDWVGVGNVQGILIRGDDRAAKPREHLIPGHGLVGYRMPSMTSSVRPFVEGDLLIMSTDGVGPGIAEDSVPPVPAKDVAQRLVERYATRKDDALVLAVRYDRHEH